MSLMGGHMTTRPERMALAEAAPGALDRWGNHADPIELRTISWGELDRRVQLAAGGLQEAGLGHGDRAVVFVPISIELYVAMLALFRLGAVVVFLDSFARQHQLGMCADLVEPKAFIGNVMAQRFRPMLGPVRKLPIQVVTGSDPINGSVPLKELEAMGQVATIAAVEAEHTALVTFTTGSSGVPKGANRTHAFLHAQHLALDGHIPYRPDDVDIPAFPIFMLNNLAAGISTVIPAIDLAEPAESDPARLVAQIQQNQVTCSTLSPAMLGRLSRYCIDQGIQLSGIHRLITGGAPIGEQMVREWKQVAPQSEMAILYGSTEVEPIADIRGQEMLDILANTDSGQGVCVGQVVDSLSHRLVRLTRGAIEFGEAGWADWDVPLGEPGELLVAGEHACPKYYRNEEATRVNKIPDGDRVWHRTGDVGYFDSENRLWLVGRVHNAILRGRDYYFPVEAEMTLKQLPFVKHPAFLGIPDEALGERTVAAFVPEAPAENPSEAQARVEAIRSALEERSFIVDDVQVCEFIPMDPRHHSKVDYDKLRGQLLAGDNRWGIYLAERFPLTSYGPMIVCFTLSSAFIGQAALGSGSVWIGLRTVCAALLLLLIFFHFRVFDECKDDAEDARLRPERPIARGVITLAEVKRAGAMAIAGEILIAALLGPQAAVAYALLLLFSLLMLKEFFVGPLLRPHLFSYAVPHTLSASVIALLVYSVVCVRYPWDAPPVVWLYALSCWPLFTLFEVARKSHAPDGERPGVPSYSSQWGPGGAALACLVLTVVSVVPVLVGVESLGLQRSVGVAYCAAFALLCVAGSAYAASPTRRTAGVFAGLCSLMLMAHGMIPAVLVAVDRGLVWGAP